MTRGYYIAVDEENGRRSWVVDWGDGSWGLRGQGGKSGFDAEGEPVGTKFAPKEAERFLREAEYLAAWEGRPGRARLFALRRGRFVDAKAEAGRKRRAAGRTIKA